MAAIVKCQDSKALVFRQRRMEEKKQTGIKKKRQVIKDKLAKRSDEKKRE